MKGISRQEVYHIAGLSSLELTEEEVVLFQKQLSETLNSIDVLVKLEKETVASQLTYQVTPLSNVYREDETDPSRMFSQAQALSNSHRSHKGFFVVPGVFSSGGSIVKGDR